MGWRLVGCAWGPLTNAVGGGGSALERQEGWNGVNGAGFGANPAVFGAGGGCDWGRWGVGRWAMGREERPLSREPAEIRLYAICFYFLWPGSWRRRKIYRIQLMGGEEFCRIMVHA